MKKTKITFERPNNGTYCMDCKNINRCGWDEIHATAISDKPCRAFEASESNKITEFSENSRR